MKDNRTGYVILGMLSFGRNASGYEIHKAIEENFGSFWGESYGQIYPALKRLSTEGLIEPCKPASAPKKRRQEYALTDAGRARLREWLALPFQNDPPRNEFLLKLFFGREAAPGVSLAHVRELQERNRRTLAMLQGIENMANKDLSQNPNKPYWMLTLSLGMALTRAALDWGESALAQLASMESAAVQSQQPVEKNTAPVSTESGR
ncbi:MAG: PadR family transcriptional regulator [Terracidiphilus sp.]|jgi:DNA-binding PadR family transcriptional regulator